MVCGKITGEIYKKEYAMTKREQIISAIALLALIIAGTFFDRSISEALYRPASAFGKIFEVVGEFPCYALAAFAFAALWERRSKKSIMMVLMCFLFTTVALTIVFHYLRWNVSAYTFLSSAALAGLLYPAARALKRRSDPDAFDRMLATILLTVFLEIVLVQGLKILWGRPRFTAVLEEISLYQPWYVISGPASGEAFKSFPSAHASDAAVVLCLTLFGSLIPLSGRKRAFLHIITYAWTLCVMLSRIVIGAHFLSDVAFGAGITFFVFSATWRIVNRWPRLHSSA